MLDFFTLAVHDSAPQPIVDWSSTATAWQRPQQSRHSPRFSAESWLILPHAEQLSTASEIIFQTEVFSQGAALPDPIALTPLVLSAAVEPLADFGQAMVADVAKSGGEASQNPEDSEGGTPANEAAMPAASLVENWEAVADVRVVPTAASQTKTPADAALLACTSLSGSAPKDIALKDTSPRDAENGQQRYELWLRTMPIADFSTHTQAEAFALQLRQQLQAGLEGDQVRPVLTGDRPAVQLGDQVVSVDAAMAEAVGYSPEWAAISAANSLRQALDTAALDPAAVEMTLKQLTPSEQKLAGTASWYGPYFHGRLTATGETFDQHQLTAAHKTLPFDTQLLVRNPQNGRRVIVRINDRGPYIGDRSLDLSKAAAQCLGSEQAGVIAYEAVILQSAGTAAERSVASAAELN